MADVPGNVSRYFTSATQARAQPRGRVELAWDDVDPLLVNRAFDEALVRHDAAYLTTSVQPGGTESLPTIEYFDEWVAPHLAPESSIVDVGCGQGEFVSWLRSAGRQAVGYDVVLRAETDHLIRSYWDPRQGSADLIVMRCVLPHIPRPWDFLRAIGETNPDALVLVEYQRLEFILRHLLWFQLSHDHVNQFTWRDFTDRFDVTGRGTFAGGEWEWVLVRPGTWRSPSPRGCAYAAGIRELAEARSRAMERASATEHPLAVWGAAGKGAMIADALAGSGASPLVAVDRDPRKHGLFMEGSGAEVLSPEEAREALPDQATILVANPRHVRDVREFVAGRFTVSSAAEWTGYR